MVAGGRTFGEKMESNAPPKRLWIEYAWVERESFTVLTFKTKAKASAT
jgi:hypothetical protein